MNEADKVTAELMALADAYADDSRADGSFEKPDGSSWTKASRAALEQAIRRAVDCAVNAEREAICMLMPGGHSVDPQWVCDTIRARNKP